MNIAVDGVVSALVLMKDARVARLISRCLVLGFAPDPFLTFADEPKS